MMKKTYKRISNVDEQMLQQQQQNLHSHSQHSASPSPSPSSSFRAIHKNSNNANTSPSPCSSTSSSQCDNANNNTNNNTNNNNNSNQNNNTKTSSSNNIEHTKKKMQQKINDKLHALLFITLSYTMMNYTNTINVICTSTLIIRPLLYISIVLLVVNSVLMFYLGVYIPKVKGMKIDPSSSSSSSGSTSASANTSTSTRSSSSSSSSGSSSSSNSATSSSELWQVYCPRVIPIMTLNGVVCGCCLMRCFWPVWGFLTPFILGIEFFGLLFVTHFIPWC